ncbi:MAG: hypothetical protein ACYCQL_02640 [Acidithiobacillus sp.]
MKEILLNILTSTGKSLDELMIGYIPVVIYATLYILGYNISLESLSSEMSIMSIVYYSTIISRLRKHEETDDYEGLGLFISLLIVSVILAIFSMINKTIAQPKFIFWFFVVSFIMFFIFLIKDNYRPA